MKYSFKNVGYVFVTISVVAFVISIIVSVSVWFGAIFDNPMISGFIFIGIIFFVAIIASGFMAEDLTNDTHENKQGSPKRKPGKKSDK